MSMILDNYFDIEQGVLVEVKLRESHEIGGRFREKYIGRLVGWDRGESSRSVEYILLQDPNQNDSREGLDGAEKIPWEKVDSLEDPNGAWGWYSQTT